jgi:glycine hydroxymethyltransferase
MTEGAAGVIRLVTGRAIPSPVPYPDVVCLTTHQVPRGRQGGMILCRESRAQRIGEAVFPFTRGGPLMHAVPARAVALREAARPEFRAYAGQVIRDRPAPATALSAEVSELVRRFPAYRRG